jgi:hypothetical protein
MDADQERETHSLWNHYVKTLHRRAENPGVIRPRITVKDQISNWNKCFFCIGVTFVARLVSPFMVRLCRHTKGTR